MTGFNPQPSDWVHILGKVVELHPNDVDLGVEVFSKTDQYTAFVRRDLCTPAKKPIRPEPDEGSVALLDVKPGPIAYQRLGDEFWYAAGAVGGQDGLTWVGLNRLGDVEVIHHA